MIQVTDFLGYAPFYAPNGVELFRLPVFNATGDCLYMFCDATLSDENANIARKVNSRTIFDLCVSVGAIKDSTGDQCVYSSDIGWGLGFSAIGDKLYCFFTSDKLINRDKISVTYSAVINKYLFLAKRGDGYVPSSIEDNSNVSSVLNSSDIVYLPMPNVKILDEPNPPEPDRIDIIPSPAFCKVGQSLQFTGFFLYGDEKVEATGGWSVEDIGNSDISISSSGLLTIGKSVDVPYFKVKLTWFGVSYNRSKSTRVTIGDSPYSPGGSSDSSGGNGSFGKDEISDIIDFPIGSTDPNSSNAGLFTKYVMTAAQMSQLGSYFWSTEFIDSVERELISKMYGKPSDTIISIMAIPIDPRDFGIASNSSHIFFGSVDSGIPSNGVLSNTAVNINWGSIEIKEYYGSFLDYAPHTKIELYLPWSTGFVSIDPNDVVGGSISVSTNLEFDKGTCTHIVSGKNGVIGTYDGVFGKQIPISSLDTGGKYLTAVMGAVGATIAGTIAVGVPALAGGATATTAGTGIATMAQSSHAMGSATQAAMSSLIPSSAEYMGIYAGKALPVFAGTSLAAFRTPSHVMRNGNFTGNTAGMNVQYPFIRVSRPTQSVPENYGHYVGYPSNIYSKLGSLRGYTEVAAIHLDGFSATVDEQNEIAELLKGGVII